MSAYAILGKDQLPEVLRDKPKWVKCVVLVASLLAITCSAVGIGIPIGYTYCYIEYKASLKMGNPNATFQILHIPLSDSTIIQQNRTTNQAKTINQALMSSLLVSKILKLSRTFMNEEISYLPTDGKLVFHT